MALSVLKNACGYAPSIAQATVLAGIQSSPGKDWLLRLDLEDWTVTSFNPHTREVCINVTNRVAGKIHVTYILDLGERR